MGQETWVSALLVVPNFPYAESVPDGGRHGLDGG
jgi:hypothetical protein